MLSIAICDDDEFFREREKNLILRYMKGKNWKCKIDMYESGKKLLSLKSALSQYNIFFLDVNMEDIDGIETAKRIREISKDVYIVFVTAYISYALDGYKVDAVRYLIKDNESIKKAMVECLNAIIDKMNYYEDKMTFDFQEGKTTVSLENILYIESNLHRLLFYMVGEDNPRYTIYTKLDDVAKILNDKGFCRIHKSYLVKLKYIQSIERYRALLSNGKSLAISKARFIETRNKFACYRGEI